MKNNNVEKDTSELERKSQKKKKCEKGSSELGHISNGENLKKYYSEKEKYEKVQFRKGTFENYVSGKGKSGNGHFWTGTFRK